MDQVSWWNKATAFLRGNPADKRAASADNDSTQSPPRLVIDTNIFIAAVRAPDSASRQLLDAIGQGRATLLVSKPVFQEYRHILSKAVGTGERQRLIREWIGHAEAIEATRGARVVTDDPDDDKFVELAQQGRATAIITNDQHLHAIAQEIEIPILRPSQAIEEWF